jgi:hypothetical protein
MIILAVRHPYEAFYEKINFAFAAISGRPWHGLGDRAMRQVWMWNCW